MRKWLGKLSFSFFILAAVLAWQGYKTITGPAPADGADQRRWGLIYFVGAGALGALGAAGVQARHQDGI